MRYVLRSGFHVLVFIGFTMGAVYVSLPGAAVAGEKPGPESCQDMGLLDVTCIVCQTGEKLGMVSVKAEYDPDYGDCGRRYREARQKCSQTYGRPLSETGCKWSHTMGGTNYKGWYPEYCEH